jgi:hypothetical protein
MVGMQPTHVTLSRESDIRYWTQEFDVTEQQLRDAVATVGPGIERVLRFLSLSKMLARGVPGNERPRHAYLRGR